MEYFEGRHRPTTIGITKLNRRIRPLFVRVLPCVGYFILADAKDHRRPVDPL